ncbi:MAG TPA: ZIP family metal transporter [bacterium]|jgi:zinc transporter ZupT|nr:ZIP family metal transporter [bacterium]
MTTLFYLGFATCMATLAGGILVLRYRQSQHYCFAFAAGSLIAVSFLDLLPESLSLGGQLHVPSRTLLLVLLVSFFLYSFIDRFFLTHHLHDDDTHGHPMGLIGAGSLVVHSCLDGVAIGVAFKASPTVGAIVATAVIVHDMTDGLNTVVVMLKHHHSAARARLFLVLDALAPLAGILAVSFMVLPESLLAYLLAFFCGEFLYLGAGSLLPETRKHGSFGITAAMTLGAGLIVLLTALI